MSLRRSATHLAICLILVSRVHSSDQGGAIETSFANPPDSARPWVWAHWLHGNVDKPAITRQLEAVKRAGLGGVTMFDVAQPGIPAGPHAYMGPSWQEHFAFQIAEAQRLGLEVMGHVGPGYSGTGGPWISEELAAQRIYQSSLRIQGGRRFTGKLPTPAVPGAFYQDVAVLAIRESDAQAKPKIDDLNMKSLVWLNYIRWKGVRSAPLQAEIPPAGCIPRENIVNLTPLMKPDGSLDWLAPGGDWTLLRFGHGWTGQKTLPAPPEGTGPECDKLDKRGVRAHFDQVMKRMVALAGPSAGRTFHSFFMDSWEAGGQNWTAAMPAEFKRRRGYDVIPWLPALTGRVIGDLRSTERFLHDLRLTVSELAVENFWAELQRLCHGAGMRLAVQPYITTGQDLDAANFTDEPMGEFWSHPFQPNDYLATVKLASSAANLNGHVIVGAEAFTAAESERWLAHPATLKGLGDRAFCLGANRLQIHRFAMQRFPQLKPGMTMGKWGQHYDSTQTWWEWSRPWHDYLARCQYLLRRGPVVTDLLVIADEEPLHRFEYHPVPGHGIDVCGPDTFRRLQSIDGAAGVPGGPSYRLLTVEHQGTMSLGRLEKLRDLVKAGACLLGEPPLATPGLENLPAADESLRALAAELWGDGRETERRVGKGRVFRGIRPAEALKRLGIPRDFEAPDHLSWIHRSAAGMDIYFIASSAGHATVPDCLFRVSGRRAELWDPLTGNIRPLDLTPTGDGRSRIALPLERDGSTFVVFRPGEPAPSRAAPEEAPFPPVAIAGPWRVSFPPESGIAPAIEMKQLRSWSLHSDPKVRHFSGTAIYQTEFTVDEFPPRPVLDLGCVEIMARVNLNGRDLGILWRPPYRVDVAGALRPGRNDLRIEVVNLWVNRLIGDAALPEDAPRDAQAQLLSWPDWVLDGRDSPTGRTTFVTFPLWKKSDSLQPSGLLGPVTLGGERPAPQAR